MQVLIDRARPPRAFSTHCGSASNGRAIDTRSAPPLASTASATSGMGGKNAWLEIVLDEGRNRQIRRLLEALDIGVLRLVRVAIGALQLGELPKGQWRELTADEVAALGGD